MVVGVFVVVFVFVVVVVVVGDDVVVVLFCCGFVELWWLFKEANPDGEQIHQLNHSFLPVERKR